MSFPILPAHIATSSLVCDSVPISKHWLAVDGIPCVGKSKFVESLVINLHVKVPRIPRRRDEPADHAVARKAEKSPLTCANSRDVNHPHGFIACRNLKIWILSQLQECPTLYLGAEHDVGLPPVKVSIVDFL